MESSEQKRLHTLLESILYNDPSLREGLGVKGFYNMTVYEEFTGRVTVNGQSYDYRGLHRDWNPPKGHVSPSGTVWEIQTVRDGQAVVGAGDSLEHARDQLMRSITFMDWFKQLENGVVALLQQNGPMNKDDMTNSLMGRIDHIEHLEFYLNRLVGRKLLTFNGSTYDLKR